MKLTYKKGIMPFLDIIGYQIKSPVSSIGYLF